MREKHARSAATTPLRGVRKRSFRWAIPLLAGAAGCFTSSENLSPPLTELYFPTALVVSPGKTALYVASSDFDLAYDGGTLHALDLALVRGRVRPIVEGLADGLGAASACAAAGLTENRDPLLYPGPCAGAPLVDFLRRTQIIGAFASGATLVPRTDGPGSRLFVTVRGDPSVTYFDVVDDRPERSGDPAASPCGAAFCLECGASADGGRCNSDHLVGPDPNDNQRRLVLPAEPVGIAASPSSEGDALLVAHQTASAVSLLVNHFTPGQKPSLEFYLTPVGNAPTEIAAVPVPAYVGAVRAAGTPFAYPPGFLVSYRGAPQIDLIRYHDDIEAAPFRPFVTRALSVGIGVNSVGTDSRGIVVEGSERAACEAACAQTDRACNRGCLDIPMDVYIANRTPASLLLGRLETVVVESADENGIVRDSSAYDTLAIYDSIPLAFGASKVALGHVIEPDGSLGLRVFTVAFDSRFVFSYDPAERRVDAVIRTGRGPHSIAFDTGEDGGVPYSYLYIGHFTDSYVGVVDLDMRRPATFGSLVATIGVPNPPRESK